MYIRPDLAFYFLYSKLPYSFLEEVLLDLLFCLEYLFPQLVDCVHSMLNYTNMTTYTFVCFFFWKPQAWMISLLISFANK